ncbi:MAG TPA: hypothetical protein VE398_24335 [Acidobacteriota bacterium]|nr:hypothetical protein [Acidobacteriota bacterium]
MRGKGFYLREGGGQYAGPFESHGDAERFIQMMESFGESCDSVDIVETQDGVDDTTDSQACS